MRARPPNFAHCMTITPKALRTLRMCVRFNCAPQLTRAAFLSCARLQALQIQTLVGPMEGWMTLKLALFPSSRILTQPITGQGPVLRKISVKGAVRCRRVAQLRVKRQTHLSCMAGSAAGEKSNCRPRAGSMVSVCGKRTRAHSSRGRSRGLEGDKGKARNGSIARERDHDITPLRNF